MSKLFDSSVDVLSKSLDLYLLRHQVIADNIANAETPHFKARKVEFEEALQRAVNLDDDGVSAAGGSEITAVRPQVSQDAESEMGQDLNTVDMDREMAAMSKNTVKYSAASEAITKKFALLRYAISEGGEK